jgi:niacin transporter
MKVSAFCRKRVLYFFVEEKETFMSKTKKLVFAGLFTALGIVLPMAFHLIGAGPVFLPMHIPVLLCGLVCGWQFGLVCGVMSPLLSSLLTGMPATAILPGMTIELAVYGAVAGLMAVAVKKMKRPAGVYIALICAMLCGRAAAGLLNAFIFRAGSYSLEMWLGASFITAWPGILIQLVVIPPLVLALKKEKVKP